MALKFIQAVYGDRELCFVTSLSLRRSAARFAAQLCACACRLACAPRSAGFEGVCFFLHSGASLPSAICAEAS